MLVCISWHTTSSTLRRSVVLFCWNLQIIATHALHPYNATKRHDGHMAWHAMSRHRYSLTIHEKHFIKPKTKITKLYIHYKRTRHRDRIGWTWKYKYAYICIWSHNMQCKPQTSYKHVYNEMHITHSLWESVSVAVWQRSVRRRYFLINKMCQQLVTISPGNQHILFSIKDFIKNCIRFVATVCIWTTIVQAKWEPQNKK